MTVTTQILEDSERNFTVHVIGEADNAGATIVDVSALSANTRFGVPTSVRLDKIKYATDKTIKFDWDADTDVTFFIAAPGQDVFNYKEDGGINNNAGTGVTGDVLIPAPAAAADYVATLWFTKKFG